eukprot:3934024-Rhodomonas_salina.1
MHHSVMCLVLREINGRDDEADAEDAQNRHGRLEDAGQRGSMCGGGGGGTSMWRRSVRVIACSHPPHSLRVRTKHCC